MSVKNTFELPPEAEIVIQAQTTSLLRVYFSLDNKGREDFLDRVKLQMEGFAAQTGQTYEALIQDTPLNSSIATKATAEEGATAGALVGAVVGAAWATIAVGSTVAIVAATGGGAGIGIVIGIMLAAK